MLRGVVSQADLISFQIAIGTMPDGNKLDLVARDIDDRDVPKANLVFGQLRGRNLPVATAVFANRIIHKLESMGTSDRPPRASHRRKSTQIRRFAGP